MRSLLLRETQLPAPRTNDISLMSLVLDKLLHNVRFPFLPLALFSWFSLIISHLCIPQRCRYGYSGETPPPLSPYISASRSSPCPINAGRHITCDCRQTVCDSICLVCLAWSRQGRKRTIWTIAFPSHAAGVVQRQINTISHLEKARSQ